MYIAYNQGERPDVRPCSLLPIHSRIISNGEVCVEEIYNADFIVNGEAYDYPVRKWYEDMRLDPLSVVFFSPNGDGSNRILSIPLPGEQIRCEECGNILEWEPRLNEYLRYCPECDDRTFIIQSYGKDIFRMDDDEFPWFDSEIPF